MKAFELKALAVLVLALVVLIVLMVYGPQVHDSGEAGSEGAIVLIR